MGHRAPAQAPSFTLNCSAAMSDLPPDEMTINQNEISSDNGVVALRKSAYCIAPFAQSSWAWFHTCIHLAVVEMWQTDTCIERERESFCYQCKNVINNIGIFSMSIRRSIVLGCLREPYLYTVYWHMCPTHCCIMYANILGHLAFFISPPLYISLPLSLNS